ncbi:hypothetical protein AZE42_04343 [Rhizopogon vesiculosus]|uniref:Ricin B lectin domain-containing protein n=1 Tax=Rhizopogon vesiculosus TaxID=180088 RepID=A0A1J8QKR6_9AGAM|nr:hypothetical protein AZE42_04343 [Rhizopogon vesiculosus]
MVISKEWQGTLTNVRFNQLLLAWQPEENCIVGQYFATGPISKYQYWKIVRQDSGWEVTVQNTGSGLYIRLEDNRLTCGDEPSIFYAIEDTDGLVGFQVPNGPTWDLETGEPGSEVTLVLNGGDFTDDQKWTPISVSD